MTTQEIQVIYEQTVNSLDKRELKTAFDALYNLTAGLRTYMFQDELNNLQETYKQLLHYYTEGTRDPMQAKIYNELTASAYELADKIRLHILTRMSSGLYYSVRRTSETHTEDEDIARLINIIISSYEINNSKSAEDAVSRLFKRIWTSGYLTEKEMTILNVTVNPDKSHAWNTTGKTEMSVLNCQIVSSLTLGLQEVFDKRKLHLLTIAAESDDHEVKIRAYTGLLITLYLYKRRIGCLPEIRHRLDALAEKPDFTKIVQMIILRFILSRETEKISNKIRDEIIPEMMKLQSKFNPYTSSPENTGGEMNPEWMEKLSGGKLGKKIEEFNKLQEEGADIMHSTFLHLKNFPFFNEISNWFIPFIKTHSLLPEEDIVLKSLEMITNVGFMCNSDLYSLYFSIKQIPESSRRMMIGQLESRLSELKQQRMAELQTKNDYIERIVGQYVQDLYRFYKLYMRRHEFNDIFSLPLDFHNIPVMGAYFSDRNDLMNIADNYLCKNYFDDALILYERLSEASEKSDETLYQKTGYCKQMTGNYEGALADYAKAEIINPESKWLLRRIAQCYRAIKRPEKAINYYLQYEKLEPENLSVLLSIGSCCLDMKNYSEALKYYFKADYLDAEGNKAWRPIAWCSFLTGKYVQARNYYNKILSYKPDTQDYMNAGHTEWVLQNIKDALELYRKSIETIKGGYEKFRVEFNRDIPELTAAGIETFEIPLLLDKLRYSLECRT
ncbi:MAG: tetratricopeptide repeat protein [Tannerella sp.]|jgi:tetratricopeptide (TPR) repeat protein|nr:tetratricopeptide repeat protein [Tannerella sp.]